MKWRIDFKPIEIEAESPEHAEDILNDDLCAKQGFFPEINDIEEI